MMEQKEVTKGKHTQDHKPTDEWDPVLFWLEYIAAGKKFFEQLFVGGSYKFVIFVFPTICRSLQDIIYKSHPVFSFLLKDIVIRYFYISISR